MAFKDTVKHLRDLLHGVTRDLDKAERGNKAASQRVRTGTVKLEKVAKLYRKESIKTEKTTKSSPKKTAHKKAASAKAHSKAKPAAHKAPVKAKAKAHKAKARPMSLKRPTAKLPVRFGAR
jgi:Histone H1-like protein Hc1